MEPGVPTSGGVILSSQTLSVDTTATYSCDPGYALVGQTIRTCEDRSGGTVITGSWSGTPPHCQGLTMLVCLNMELKL